MTKSTMIRTIFIFMTVFATAASAQPPGGPGEGMWERFADRFDADGDGVVTREEFDQQASRFPHLDDNGDGVLTADDFESAMRGRMGARVVRPADADRDRTVSAQEWVDFLAVVDPDSDGVIEVSDLLTLLHQGRPDGGPPHGSPPDGAEPGQRLAQVLDRDGDEVLETEDLNTIFVELDADGDGALSSEELPRFRGPRGRRGGHGSGGKGPGSGGPGRPGGGPPGA